MSGNEEELIVDIAEWVDRSRADPVAHLERQATEVLLTAIGMSDSVGDSLYLKGGILMGVVYKSTRSTGDIDFSVGLPPDVGVPELIKKELNEAFPRAAADIGNPDLLCAVQSISVLPRNKGILDSLFPALDVRIGYAVRGSAQEQRFHAGKAVQTLKVDISFNEPIGAIQVVRLDSENQARIRAYSLCDVITEKIRALLQQPVRNRNRRQDVYDLSVLIQQFSFNPEELSKIHDILKRKCFGRGVAPALSSLQQKEVIRKAREEWDTLELEIGELPDFDHCFEIVNRFYKSLPWR
jgi:Nucleotidyl transferase AbiEii toxin, Type IV TA system